MMWASETGILSRRRPEPTLRPLVRTRLPRDTVALARHLLGKVLVRELRGERVLARIAETEAYVVGDPACHGFRGRTARNASLFLDLGHAYVYLCYGNHHLLNVASERAGIGAGVLIRALEPLTGLETLLAARPQRARDGLRGPGRLTATLDIGRRHDGIDLLRPGELWLASDARRRGEIGVSTRIGLKLAAERRLRFFLRGSPWLSGPRSLNA